MQELLDELDLCKIVEKHNFFMVKYIIEQCLEKEKEQIKDAFKIGVIEGLGMESNSLGFDANEEIYYNQTYKK